MKEANWSDCLETNNAFSSTADLPKAKSLREIALLRLDFCNRNTIDEKSANFLFEDYYASLLELLHALIILRKYKVNNHVCVGFFIRDVLRREDFFSLFDNFRFKRNSITYYGKPMEFAVAEKTIQNCIFLIKEVEKILEHELGQN